MKTFKTLLMPLMFVALAALTACNDDEGEDYVFVPLTPAEKAAQINDMKGSYTGKLYYNVNLYFRTIGDSANVTFDINAADTTLVINDFPLKAFSSAMGNSAMQEAFLNGGTNRLVTRLFLYRPWGTSGELNHPFFNIIPMGEKELTVQMPLKINDEMKNVTLLFTTAIRTGYDAYYATGEWEDNYLGARIILSQVAVEGGGTYDTSTLCILSGNK